MYFYNVIKELAKKQEIIMYVDMDGVISSYDIGKPLNFATKRPLTENINKLKQISKIQNVELYILSICKKDFQIDEKNVWLDKYAPFFKKENRIIISKENKDIISSSQIKADYLKNIVTNKQIVFVDDDNEILKTVLKTTENVIVFQDSELID